MKNLGIPYAIGYLIAGLVVLPLIILGINKLFFQGNDVEKYIKNYINHSEELKVKIDLSAKNNYTLKDFKSRKKKFYIRT